MLRFGTRSFPTRADTGDRTRTRVSRLTLLEPLQRLGGSSRFELIRKVRAFFGIVGVFVGIYVHSSSAMAAVEEDDNQEASQSGYSIPALYQQLTSNISVGNITDGEALVPETVWSLDASSGVHLDRISGASGSEINTVFDVPYERAEFGFGSTLGFLGANDDERARYLLAAPPVFQVASCGGSSAEHPDLDRCDNTYNTIDQSADDSKKNRHVNSDNTTIASSYNSAAAPNDTNSTTVESINPSTPSPYTLNLENTPDNVHDLSWLTLAAALTSPIDDPAAPIDDLTAPIDDLTAPINDPTDPTAPAYNVTTPVDILTPPTYFSPPEVVPPSPIIFVGDPGPGSGRRPIPEAPTWVMTTIGFIVVVFLFRKKKRNRVIPISIIDVL